MIKRTTMQIYSMSNEIMIIMTRQYWQNMKNGQFFTLGIINIFYIYGKPLRLNFRQSAVSRVGKISIFLEKIENIDIFDIYPIFSIYIWFFPNSWYLPKICPLDPLKLKKIYIYVINTHFSQVFFSFLHFLLLINQLS